MRHMFGTANAELALYGRKLTSKQETHLVVLLLIVNSVICYKNGLCMSRIKVFFMSRRFFMELCNSLKKEN